MAPAQQRLTEHRIWQTDRHDYVKLISRSAQTDADQSYTRHHLSASRDFQRISLTQRQPPATPLPEFQATVAVNCSQRGVQLALRMLLPRQIDPRTGQPLVTYIEGDGYTTIETWQNLRVQGSSKDVAKQIRSLRAELNLSTIDASDAYFDAVVLTSEVHQGDTFLDVGQVSWHPVVPPNNTVPAEDLPDNRLATVRVQRERLVRDDQPFFMTLMPDHGESVEAIAQIGCNAVWVPDAGASRRMTALLNEGLLVLATPPHPEFDPTDFSTPIQGLPPLEHSHPLPSLWYIATAVEVNQFPHLLAWAREVRSADRKLRRPLVADVRSGTDVASRQIDVLGLSQHSLGGRHSFGKVRNAAFVRQNASAQMAVPWEWIPVEASENVRSWRARTGSQPIFAEPEQILMQTAACISAGSRGIGIWKTKSLASETQQNLELRYAIELANIYVRILEPFVANGRVDGHLPIQTDPQPIQQASWQFGAAREPQMDYSVAPVTADGAVIGSGGASVVLACHWDLNSQFVPQKMFSADAAFTVAATETASAWRVSATQVRGLRRQRTAGGLYVRISDFDQLAIVLVSSDPEARRRIERRVHENAARAAQLLAELAQLKLTRVRGVCESVDQQRGKPGTATELLAAASKLANDAAAALNRHDYTAVESAALHAMRVTREIQNQYWYRAVQTLPSPAASPHTVSFSSLPDHWKMMRHVETTLPGDNLIPSGNFDDVSLFSESQWKPVSSQPNDFRTSATIVDDVRETDNALRMRAWPKNNTPTADYQLPTLMLQSPEITAVKGDLFEIRGRVRLGANILSANETPLIVFDTDLGPELAVSPQLEPSWRTFHMYRQASADGPFHIWLALQGAAEVYVDDLTVVRRRIATDQNSASGQGLPHNHTPAFGNPRSRVQGAGYSIPQIP